MITIGGKTLTHITANMNVKPSPTCPACRIPRAMSCAGMNGGTARKSSTLLTCGRASAIPWSFFAALIPFIWFVIIACALRRDKIDLDN